MEEKLAAVLIRNFIRARKDAEDTLQLLLLLKKHACVIVPKRPSYVGMLKKVSSYVTWGEIDKETEALLIEKRGKNKKFFSLSPPRGGFERNGIKKPFNMGGALGYRGNKMNDLLKKMI